MSIDGFERDILGSAIKHLESHKDEIKEHLYDKYSCEPYLNYLLAQTFRDGQLFCAREVPYADILDDFEDGGNRLDLMIVKPDKTRCVLAEVKQVHNATQKSYRDRAASSGHSIAHDIDKLRKISLRPGWSRLLLVLMTNYQESNVDPEKPTDWLEWLKDTKATHLPWERIVTDEKPAIVFDDGGWIDLCVYKVD